MPAAKPSQSKKIVGASPERIGKFCADVLLDSKTGWINRRKDTIDLQSETLLRHQQSIDFNIHSALRAPSPSSNEMYYLPLLLLRKEPGRLTRFDVEDEAGRSLPLPTRARNAEVSTHALIAAAQRTAGRANPKFTLPKALEPELSFIASAGQRMALSFAKALYLEPDGADQHAPRRAQLVADEHFRWLLTTLAWSSVVLFRIEGEPGERRILKLSFDELIADVTSMQSGSGVFALGYRIGWRGYLIQAQQPFIGARSYHFELHSPPGLEVIEAGMANEEPGAADAHRVHLYLPQAEAERTTIVYSQFRVRGEGFVTAAALISIVIALSLAAVWAFAKDLAGPASSAPPLLLLFPGLAATYLARPGHPLVTRLLSLARGVLVVAAGCAYIGAARFAVATTSHPATEASLTAWFRPLTVVAAAMALTLVMARFLPFRISHPLRKLGRRLTGSSGPIQPSSSTVGV